jgi:hypothetical protein
MCFDRCLFSGRVHSNENDNKRLPKVQDEDEIGEKVLHELRDETEKKEIEIIGASSHAYF